MCIYVHLRIYIYIMYKSICTLQFFVHPCSSNLSSEQNFQDAVFSRYPAKCTILRLVDCTNPEPHTGLPWEPQPALPCLSEGTAWGIQNMINSENSINSAVLNTAFFVTSVTALVANPHLELVNTTRSSDLSHVPWEPIGWSTRAYGSSICQHCSTQVWVCMWFPLGPCRISLLLCKCRQRDSHPRPCPWCRSLDPLPCKPNLPLKAKSRSLQDWPTHPDEIASLEWESQELRVIQMRLARTLQYMLSRFIAMHCLLKKYNTRSFKHFTTRNASKTFITCLRERGTCDDGENFAGIDIDPNHPQRMKKTNTSRRQDRQMEFKDED